MSNPKNQHWVPVCYLTEFVDPSDGFVRIFSKDGKSKRKQRPKKVFRSNHLYTIEVKGSKNYRIEQTLSNIEGKYAEIFKKKIKKKIPLSEYEHIILCIFIAAQFQRTLRFKRNQESFIQEIIERGEEMAIAHGIDFKQKQEWEIYKKDIHKLQLFEGLPFLTNILYKMNIAFLCSINSKRNWFITSDDPCNLFNSDLQWQRFHGPGFGQKNVQLTLPLSLEITVLFCWANYRGYSTISGKRVEDMNRMTRGHCDKEFVTSTEKKKWIWFSNVPMDPIFLLKVLKTKVRFLFHDLKTKYRHRAIKR